MPGEGERVEVDEDEETHPVNERLGDSWEESHRNIAELGKQWKYSGE